MTVSEPPPWRKGSVTPNHHHSPDLRHARSAGVRVRLVTGVTLWCLLRHEPAGPPRRPEPPGCISLSVGPGLSTGAQTPVDDLGHDDGMATRAFPDLPRQRGLATRRQLREAGWTPSAVRHAVATTWQEPAPEVFADHRGDLDAEVRLVAAALWAGPAAVLTAGGPAPLRRAGRSPCGDHLRGVALVAVPAIPARPQGPFGRPRGGHPSARGDRCGVPGARTRRQCPLGRRL